MAKILLSEGSSLSARETITALGLAGHKVEILTSDSHCLGRFSRFVEAIHKAPASGTDPSGYLQRALQVIATRKIDVLLPTNEQAYLFAAARDQIPEGSTGFALAPFRSFEQVQSKERFSMLLTRLGVPQPQTSICNLKDVPSPDKVYPFYLKTAFGTASEGVWRVENVIQKRALLADLERRGTKRVVVQSESDGHLERAQSVFDNGRLVAFHTYRQIARGPGGGDVQKLSVSRPYVAAHVEKIGADLAWHGALSFDYFQEDASVRPLFIDANPRIVEPMSALSAGVDLVGALVDVSLGLSPLRQSEGNAGVATRLGMMGLMEAAGRRGKRRDVVREAILMLTASGRYRGTVEELLPLRIDPWAAVPLTAIAVRLLLSPKSTTAMRSETVRNYCLTADAFDQIEEWNADAEFLSDAKPALA